MADLYRKSSLEKLSDPEQLDKAVVISSPMSWLALIGVLIIIIAVLVWSVLGTLPTTVTVRGIVSASENAGAYYSDYSGIVTDVSVKEGDKVSEGQTLLTVKGSDGKEHDIKADCAGTVSRITAGSGQMLTVGTEAVRYAPESENEQVIVCYAPAEQAQKLNKGMKVLVFPSSADTDKYGHFEAQIVSVGKYTANTENMAFVTGRNNMLADSFLQNGPVYAVICRIVSENGDPKWSGKKDGAPRLSNGSLVSAKIVTAESSPISKLFCGLGN